MPVDINGTTGVTTPGLASAAMPTSGGDPVVESGSNSDGKWTRWADGTQTCSVSGIVSDTLKAGKPHAAQASWTYPSGFSENPEVTFSIRGNSSLSFEDLAPGYVTIYPAYAEMHTVHIEKAPLPSADAGMFFVIATGRWK